MIELVPASSGQLGLEDFGGVFLGRGRGNEAKGAKGKSKMRKKRM